MTKIDVKSGLRQKAAKDMGPHLVKMAPHFVEKVWGGRKLADLFGKEISPKRLFGESWEVADLPEGQSRVASGPLQGLTLGELSKVWGRRLTGRGAADGERFPLLIKLLDAREDLSVQVHPGPEDLAALPGAHSKDEAWLILDVDDGACIIHGLNQDGVSAEEFRRALEAGEISELLERVPVAAGDVIRVKPGTIHAICKGVALLEVQEPSDTTYRVYDYDRPGLDGKPRALHLDEAMQVSWLGRSEQVVLAAKELAAGLELLVNAPNYRIERLRVGGGAEVSWQVDTHSPQVLQVLSGAVELEDGLGGAIELKAFETAVVPAAFAKVSLSASEEAVLIVSGLCVERGLVQELEIKEREAVLS